MADPKPRILIVDDERTNLKLLGMMFAEKCHVSIALSGERALHLASLRPQPDLILLDIRMPEMDGYEVCRRLKASPDTKGIAVVFITALTEEEDEKKGLDLGAVDYITKPFHPAIVLARISTHLELKRKRDLLNHLSSGDELNGVPNRRRHLEEVLDLEWRHALRAQSSISLILIEIDHFKQFKDDYGHARSNACIRSVIHALQAALRRPSAVLTRFGDGQFACVLPYTDSKGAAKIAERMRTAVCALTITRGHSSTAPYITISLGVATAIPHDNDELQTIIELADKRLHEAKRAGHNRVNMGRKPKPQSGWPRHGKASLQHNGPIKPHVLIVDDDRLDLDTTRAILEQDYQISLASDGKQALDMATSKPQPDIILLDIDMPAIDGFEVCKRLQSIPNTQSIPIILLGAVSESDDEAKGLELGAVDYLSKPLRQSVLRARLKLHLRFKRIQQELFEKNVAFKQLLSTQRSENGNPYDDLNGPLNRITGMLRILLKDQGIAEEHKALLESIERCTHQMLALFAGHLTLR